LRVIAFSERKASESDWEARADSIEGAVAGAVGSEVAGVSLVDAAASFFYGIVSMEACALYVSGKTHSLLGSLPRLLFLLRLLYFLLRCLIHFLNRPLLLLLFLLLLLRDSGLGDFVGRHGESCVDLGIIGENEADG
jgi:hypothetical protein